MNIRGMNTVGSVLYLAQSLTQIEADIKSTRKVDLEHSPLCKSADSFPHHIRERITVKVPVVTKRIRLCANGPFWTLFSLTQHYFMAKAGGRIDIYLFIYLNNYDTSEYSIFFIFLLDFKYPQ